MQLIGIMDNTKIRTTLKYTVKKVAIKIATVLEIGQTPLKRL